MLDIVHTSQRSPFSHGVDHRCAIGVLSTWHPEPADNGRKQRTRMIIQELQDQYEIILISLLPEDEVNGQMLAPVPGVSVQYALPLPAFKPRSPKALFGALHQHPRSVWASWDARTAREIAKISAVRGIRCTIGTDLRTLRYLQSLPDTIAKILDEPDVSPFLADMSVSGWIQRPRRALRAWKYQRLLSDCLSQINTFIVASATERLAFESLSGCSEAILLENAVERLPEPPWSRPAGCQFLYTGSLSYQPNMEAASFFATHILPKLGDHLSEAQLVVTGRIPTHVPEELRSSRISLTGLVPDLDPIIRSSSVFVVPLRSGTGTRVKILEALAYGMPIVSTSKGAEGLPVQDGVHLLLADSTDEFVGAILQLQKDRDLAKKLGQSGRKLVAERFTWKVRGDLLRQLMSDLNRTKSESIG